MGAASLRRHNSAHYNARVIAANPLRTMRFPPRTKMVTAFRLGQPSMTSILSLVVPKPTCSKGTAAALARHETARHAQLRQIAQSHTRPHVPSLWPGRGWCKPPHICHPTPPLTSFTLPAEPSLSALSSWKRGTMRAPVAMASSSISTPPTHRTAGRFCKAGGEKRDRHSNDCPAP